MRDKALEWIAHDPDENTRAELEALLAYPEVLAERFAGRLKFGTAGLRGVLGAGPMGMNRAVVIQTTKGLADYVFANVQNAQERGVVIGYDGRHMSRQFARDAASVLAAAGFRVHRRGGLSATPLCAYAVKELSAAAGIMITASHNPPEYNGYKVYWENGAQIVPPHDRGIAEAIAAAGWADDITMDVDAEKGAPTLDDALLERYYKEVLRLMPPGDKARISVAYTPLHGVGAEFVTEVMSRSGFVDLHVEANQKDPDGDFPTVAFPNPEEPGAMDLVTALGQERKVDLILASDPDADRLAVALPKDGDFEMLSGDQIGVLLADYLLEQKIDNALVATTIVSSQLLSILAKARGAECLTTLTGFKWIANGAMAHKEKHKSNFVVGYEEAIGYTVGELVRDKDGVSAALVFAALCASDMAKGKTIPDRLEAIYRRHGIYKTSQVSKVLPGTEGAALIAATMAKFREQASVTLAGFEVKLRRDLIEGAESLPPSNVLIYQLEDQKRIIMRPSGTEPKLKCYYEVREGVAEHESIEVAMMRAESSLRELSNRHQAELAAALV